MARKAAPIGIARIFVGLDESLQAGVEFYANAALTVLNELS